MAKITRHIELEECKPIQSRFSPTTVPCEEMVTEEILDNGTTKEISRERIEWCDTIEELNNA